MRKLFLKLMLFLIPVVIYAGTGVFVDAYNVFHYKDIRITDASSNRDYIKTRYVLENKDRFNAFLFGSSRAANMPLEGLPLYGEDGGELHWYNMTYPMGSPEANAQTLETFLRSGVEVKEVILMIDEIGMYKTADNNLDNPIYATYRTYEQSPAAFWYSYLKRKPVWRILPQIFDNEMAAVSDDEKSADILYRKKLFYDYGVEPENTDLTVPSDGEMYSALPSGKYSGPDQASVRALRDIVSLCDDNGIVLKVIATPILKTTYRKAVKNGYLDYLRAVAGVTDFYCFSGLNAYTTDGRYYFDNSHFRPYVGRMMEYVLFGDDGQRGWALSEAAGASSEAAFGCLVTADNADELIKLLEDELH